MYLIVHDEKMQQDRIHNCERGKEDFELREGPEDVLRAWKLALCLIPASRTNSKLIDVLTECLRTEKNRCLRRATRDTRQNVLSLLNACHGRNHRSTKHQRTRNRKRRHTCGERKSNFELRVGPKNVGRYANCCCSCAVPFHLTLYKQRSVKHVFVH